MMKHIVLAEIIAAILVAAIFAMVCGRARAEPEAPLPESPPIETIAELDAP